MKEVEKNEIKRLSDRLDAIRHQQADLSLVEAADKYAELEKENHPRSRNYSPARSSGPETKQRSPEADEPATSPRNHQKRAGRYGQAEEKRSRTGDCASDDRPVAK
jgi:ribosome-associated protein